jgi:outer membrane phospholipase A
MRTAKALHWLLCFSAVCCFYSAVCRAAEGITAALVVPTEAVPAGTDVEFNLVLLNAGSMPAQAKLPLSLTARLVSGDRVWPVVVNIRTTAFPVVPGGGFSHADCSLKVPDDAVGRLTLEVDDPKTRAVLDVVKPVQALAEGEPSKRMVAPLQSAGKVPALSAYHRVFAENISTHHPIYFIFGPNKPAAKFQFSFKYRLLGDKSTAGTLNPPLGGVYFGYTQRSIWDITSYSSPFYDTSYMPELMYESLTPAPAEPGFLGFKWYGYQASVQHESNGRDGTSSRSLNLFYVRPIVGRDLGENWTLGFAPKLFVYVDNLSDNRDLARYRGYGEYMLVLSRRNSWSLTALGRIGSHFDRGSIQLDWSYPLRISYWNFASYLLVQYFDGYGESLLGYNRKSHMLRAGFELVR